MHRAGKGAAIVALLSGFLVGAAAPNEPPTADRVRAGIGMTVPWAVGGPRIEPNGDLIYYPGQWPTVPVTHLRLWDTRTAWLNLEPADDQWDFRRLDEFLAVAAEHGVEDVNLVLAGTPRWAAAQVRPTDASWLGPGSASPPASMEEWTEFVRTVATRYRGRIGSYSIGNEPTDPTFWSGTPAQWARLVATAASVISQVDPEATVTASGFPMDGPADVARALPWFRALANSRADVDVLAFHWYPRPNQLPSLVATMKAVRRSTADLGLPTTWWVTEANLRGGSALSAKAQRGAVASLVRQGETTGVERIYWYAWLDIPPKELMVFQPGTPGARELARIYSD